MKKLSIILAAAIVLGMCLETFSLAAYENTYANTGNQLEDIIGVAATQVGNNDGKKYNNPNGYAWCAYFIVWCARQAGIDSSVVKNAGVATSDALLGSGRYNDKSTGYVPKRGDILIYDWVSNGLCSKTPRSAYGDHVGIVVAVDSKYVYTIEGNRGGKVQKVTTALSNADIKGYGTPNYKTGGKAAQQPAPAAPSNLTVARGDAYTAKMSWSAVSGATSYEVQYYKPVSAVWAKVNDYKSGTSFIVTGLVNNSYDFRVRAVNSAGSSAWVNITYTRTAPAAQAPAAPSSGFSLDGQPATMVDKAMNVKVPAGNTLRFCNTPTSNNKCIGSIPNNASV
jgi:hypothetical protein